MPEKENIEIELSLEEYFVLNEEARKQGKLLDDFIEDLLKEYLEKHKNKDK